MAAEHHLDCVEKKKKSFIKAALEK